ncbi:hypothetical protein GCM10010168_21460 [Actinoplanes ianthinogenes]|uniref:SGNH hydrolase-type esterase domain-containing protein n=1 Tax=Actinoplanes ianthinogenes TaxID=122358 RepID=A0ABN6CRH0_9ACTN|nr:SGNH/GDSL hydrolase family protein [Actinoplanes ianthinogenes]BCJ47787.1 hypothetical protein Aiant_84440 [Actinoplanes ianthinogenes]GGR04154.1 hypothetical protein GCM10010168_21460 [Actinoplanes ianthinogenes]
MIVRRTAAALAVALGLTACATQLRAMPGSPIVVTLGDSVPAGTACSCTPFPDLYARMLSPRAQSVNLAQPGFTTADVQDQISHGGIRDSLRAASVVLVMAGANDMAEAIDDGDDYVSAAQRVGAAMSSIVNAVRADHGSPVKILVLGYWNVVKDGDVGLAEYGADGLKAAKQATSYDNDALRQAAGQSGATFLTTSALFTGDPTGLLAADGDHPNAAGHQAIAHMLYGADPEP